MKCYSTARTEKWNTFPEILTFFLAWGGKITFFVCVFDEQFVLKINAIYEARRGKKRVKRLSQSTESNSGKGKGTLNLCIFKTC